MSGLSFATIMTCFVLGVNLGYLISLPLQKTMVAPSVLIVGIGCGFLGTPRVYKYLMQRPWSLRCKALTIALFGLLLAGTAILALHSRGL